MNYIEVDLPDGTIEIQGVSDAVVWAEHWGRSRRVAKDYVNGMRISTVFLGVDHGGGAGEPILYETMIFETFRTHDFSWRYCTREEAQFYHTYVVDCLRRGMTSEEIDGAHRPTYTPSESKSKSVTLPFLTVTIDD